jgi:hypothetical protein
MPRFADRVQETTTTTGTGSITLSGTAATRCQRFQDAHLIDDWIHYVIEGQSGSEWEVGAGRLTGTTTLSRENVYASSNAGALVNFSAGTKDVYTVVGAENIDDSSLGMRMAMGGGWYI